MERNLKKSILFGLAVLVVVTLVLTGLTYAYYRTRIIGNQTDEQSVSVTSKKLEVTYKNGSGINTGIQEPGYTASNSFSVENTGDDTGYYSISLENVTNTFERKGDWTYSLIKNGVVILDGVPVPGADTHISYEQAVEKGATDQYTLTIKYDNLRTDQSVDMDAMLSFKINITDAVEEPDMFKNAISGTLLEAIGNHNIVSEPLTEPGKNTSPQETVLAETEDDYGKTYYFRGRIPNNYVTIDNTCWMILRVLGNGNIKLVLADGNKACGIENGYDWKDGTSGLMNSAQPYTYGSEVVFSTSNVKTVLDAWLTDRGLYHSQYQVYADWCNDTSYIYDEATQVSTYSSVSRFNFNVSNPTLKCDNENATKYTFDSGILSADEIAFAGGSLESPSEPSWININADSTWWWTMTPSKNIGDNTVWNFMGNWMQLNNNGNIKNYTGDNGGAIRPAIVIQASTPISGGNGSLNNPYIIS